MNKIKKNRKGFTLAELLAVVAIIAVLVAIAIPVFTSATKKAEEAVEVANARSVYGEAMVEYVSGNTIDATDGLKRTYDGKDYVFTPTYTGTGTNTKMTAWEITVTDGYNTYSGTISDTGSSSTFDSVKVDGTPNN